MTHTSLYGASEVWEERMEVWVTFLDIKLGKQTSWAQNSTIKSFPSLVFSPSIPRGSAEREDAGHWRLAFVLLREWGTGRREGPMIWNLLENFNLFLTFSLIFMLWLCRPQPGNWNHDSERNHLLSYKIGKGFLIGRADCSHRRESWIGESLILCSSRVLYA